MASGGPGGELSVGDLGGLGTEIGRGGQAVIYELPAFTLPGVAGPLVYKRYLPGHPPREQSMNDLIAAREGLDDADRHRLDSITAWPLRIVKENNAVDGVVLPRIPAPFFEEIVLPSGRRKSLPREVQHLFVDRNVCERIGMSVPTAEQRLAICRDFAAALAFLHGPSMDAVFGDINAKNELFRLDAEPMVMFVDCDAVRIRGKITGAPQLNAPDWTPPHQSRALSQQTDLYKLGLFVLRCLTAGPQCSTRLDPRAAAGVLDDEGVALLTAAVEGDPAARPSAEEWLRYLTGAFDRATDPPELTLPELERTFVVAGDALTLSWRSERSRSLDVSVPGCPDVVLTSDLRAGSIQVRPVHTGVLTVVARNDYGSTEARTRPVAVLGAHGWTDLPVPMPRLPLVNVSPADLPDVSRVLALAPAVAGATVPAVEDAFPPPPVPPPPLVQAWDGVVPVDVVSIMMSGPPVDRYAEGRAFP